MTNINVQNANELIGKTIKEVRYSETTLTIFFTDGYFLEVESSAINVCELSELSFYLYSQN